MKRFTTICVALFLIGLSAKAVRAVDYTIYPTSPQDGALMDGVGVQGPASGFGIWGFVNGGKYVQAGIHTLPPITAASVGCAVLRIPETDVLWSTNGANILTMDWFADHFDALNDTQLINGDENQPSLGTLGRYRKAGPRSQDLARYTEIKVTAAVKADLNAGRASFAWRLRPAQAPSPSQANEQMYLPTVDAVGFGYPPANTGARLIIYGVCPFEGNCTNGIDDDGDGKIDCADSDCTTDVACPEVCNDGIDNNGDGIVDCADPQCLGSPLCPETICNNGIDDDNDGLTDCNDPNCSNSPSCPEICNDGIDNNANGMVDCADPQCASFPQEPCTETHCADGLDNDGDGQIDCADSNCTTSLACAGSVMIQPGVIQDGPIYGGSAERNWPYGWWGNYGGTPMNEVGIHTLPLGVSAADIGSAVLRIPRPDTPWQGTEALALNMLVKHIDATNDAQIEVADKNSAPLDAIGVYRAPGPYVPDNSRYIEFRVTQLVKNDLIAGRLTFAWRVEAESLPNSAFSYRYIPTVENPDVGAFGDNRGAKLFLYKLGVIEDSCTDGIDNDHDGLIDCQDPDCSGSCPEVCNDGIDNNANGLVDCNDPQCLSSPACPELLCADGIDNDNDGKIDCADSDCFGGFECQHETGNCSDGQDNDNDCLVDGADPDCSTLNGIRPLPNQDAPIYGNTFVELGAPYGWWGAYDGGPMVTVGMHNLPSGVPALNVQQAILRLPRHDLQFTADQSALNMNMRVKHIDAANDSMVTAADKTSTPLADLGLYRAPGAYTADNARFVELDVTTRVRADITAGRTTFAWRIETDSAISPGQSSYRYFPTVDDQTTAPVNNRSALILKINGQYESNCADGIDNDGDGKTDCADADCYNTAACPAEVCGDGVDNDGDGLIDCADSDCLFNSCCTPPVELCANGVDDDGDGQTDCADSDCRCAPNCGGPTPENCTNHIDDDCDGAVDCADTDCVNTPACLNCHNPFADTDSDGDVDVNDFAVFQRCYTGPGGNVTSQCLCFDRNSDGHITSVDLEFFQLCASRSGLHADPLCDGSP